VSGDVNAAGDIELWAQAGNTATPYTLSGTDLRTTVDLPMGDEEPPRERTAR
jgi:hypothetical protein